MVIVQSVWCVVVRDSCSSWRVALVHGFVVDVVVVVPWIQDSRSDILQVSATHSRPSQQGLVKQLSP